MNGPADDGQDLARGDLLLDRLRQKAEVSGSRPSGVAFGFLRIGQDVLLGRGVHKHTCLMSRDHTGWNQHLLAPVTFARGNSERESER
jgi:hypothetical protein